jgi:hypothetical protein
MKRRMWTLAALLSSAALVAGIGAVWVRADVGPQQTDRLVESDSTRSGDVLLPMPAMIRRFQATLPRVNALGDGSAASRDALVEAFAAAVEDSSAARLHRLRLDAAEFGWLYFPESRYTTKPYELPPETLWMLMDQNSRKAETRLLRSFGGRPLGFAGYQCEAAPRREGPNRYWERCVVTLAGPEGRRRMRLFGSIMERDGRFKFVSIANDL